MFSVIVGVLGHVSKWIEMSTDAVSYTTVVCVMALAVTVTEPESTDVTVATL